MLLRRVIEHVKTQNWTAVALDFVIVVVGVFVGIQVSNWNDARQERVREQTTLTALLDDFVAIRERLTEYADGSLKQMRDMTVVAEALEKGAVPEGEEENFRYGLLSLLYSVPPPQNSGTLEGLIAGGGLAEINDDELRRLLFDFQSYLENAETQMIKFGRTLLSYKDRTRLAIKYAIPSLKEMDAIIIGEFKTFESFSETADQLDEWIADYDLEALRADPQVRQSFVEARSIHLATITWALGLRERADTVIARLDALGVND